MQGAAGVGGPPVSDAMLPTPSPTSGRERRRCSCWWRAWVPPPARSPTCDRRQVSAEAAAAGGVSDTAASVVAIIYEAEVGQVELVAPLVTAAGSTARGLAGAPARVEPSFFAFVRRPIIRGEITAVTVATALCKRPYKPARSKWTAFAKRRLVSSLRHVRCTGRETTHLSREAVTRTSAPVLTSAASVVHGDRPFHYFGTPCGGHSRDTLRTRRTPVVTTSLRRSAPSQYRQGRAARTHWFTGGQANPGTSDGRWLRPAALRCTPLRAPSGAPQSTFIPRPCPEPCEPRSWQVRRATIGRD